MQSLSRYALLLLVFLAACVPTPDASSTPDATAVSTLASETAAPAAATVDIEPDPTPTGEATVRFVHAAPDVEAVTVYAGSNAVATNLAFGQSTDATTITAGNYTFRVNAAGSRSSGAPLLEQSAALQAGEALLLILTGTDEISFRIFPAAVSPLADGESAVTIINLTEDMPPSFDVYQGENLVATSNMPDAADPIRLSSGTASLELRSGADTLMTVVDDWLEGIQRTLIVVGSRANPTTIRFDTPAPGRTALRVVNAIPDAVDVYLDDSLLASNLAYSQTSNRQDAITGEAAIHVVMAGANPASDTPLASQPVTLNNTPYHTVYILGPAENPRITAYPDDLSPTPAGQARIAFINTLDRFPNVRLETGSGTLVTARFGEAPAFAMLTEGEHNFIWIGEGEDAIEATIELADNVELRAGYSYLYLVTGRTDSPPIVLGESASGTGNEAASVQDSASVRLVNALQDLQPVTFLADDTPLATVEYGQGTELLAVAPSNVIIGAQINGNLAATADVTLESGKTYTLVAYGAEEEQVSLLLIPDTGLILTGAAPHLRLINVGLDIGVPLGLGYSAPAPAVENLPEGTDEPTVDSYRRSIPGGLLPLVNDIPGGAASGLILMSPGTFNLYILDSSLSKLATTLDFVELEAGAHYDVLAYQEYDTPRVRVFILAYPPRLD